ncbi:MAG: hypothetical protein WKF77_16265 [Planctomycetaceae bacterium]
MKNWNRTVGSWLLILAFAGSLSGCATIVSGRRHEVTVDNSGGATCFSILDNQNRVVHSGVTPQQVTLKSSSAPFQPAKYQVVFAGQDGAQQYDLNANINWWTAGNIVIGGVPGIVIDAASGALWRLQPNVTGQVPSQNVVSNPTQGAAVLAADSGRGASTLEVTATVGPAGEAGPAGKVRRTSFVNPNAPEQTGQNSPATRKSPQ